MDNLKENWYVAFFDGDVENGYAKACSDEEAIIWFKQEAKDEGWELLEVYQCNDDECLTLKQRVFPEFRLAE